MEQSDMTAARADFGFLIDRVGEARQRHKRQASDETYFKLWQVCRELEDFMGEHDDWLSPRTGGPKKSTSF